MSNLLFINFDTNYLTTDIANPYDFTYLGNPFNTTFNLSDPLRKVRRVYLKSVEMPVGFYNIRPNFDTLILELFDTTHRNATTFNIIVPNKNYTSITQLLTAINNQIQQIQYLSYNAAYLPQFYVSGSGSKLYVSGTGSPANVNNGNVISFNFVKTNLLTEILGFSTAFRTLADLRYADSNRSYNLNYDTYLSFYCDNIPHKSAGFGNQLMTFKIPFNSTSGSIFYEADNVSYSHYVEITDKHFILNKLKVKIYDQFNNLLDNNGLNWSFTLAFEFWED